jgi:ectoine hydroxylase-related dioxygenase (phytanoyl-CoA dioxygenase family)
MNIPAPRFSPDAINDGVSFFRDHGYVILGDFFSAEELADFRSELSDIIRAYSRKAGLPMPAEPLSNGLLALEDCDHEYVAAAYDTIFQSPSFLRIAGKRETAAWTKALLGLPSSAALYGYTNRCRIDPPGDDRRTYGWHQEVFYTIPRGEYVQTWAPLVFDTTTENGTIEIAAGSHKEGVALQSWTERQGGATQVLVDESVTAKYPQGSVDMRLGEMLLFSGKLAHRSGSNISDQVRCSLVGMYHDVGHMPFVAPKIGFSYRGATPREYFDEIFPAQQGATPLHPSPRV